MTVPALLTSELLLIPEMKKQTKQKELIFRDPSLDLGITRKGHSLTLVPLEIIWG